MHPKRKLTHVKRAKDDVINWSDATMPDAIVSNKKIARSAKKRDEVVWNDAPVGASTARQNIPAPYFAPPNPSVDHTFVSGMPFLVVEPLAYAERGTYFFAPLETANNTKNVVVPSGTLVVYAGPVREVERTYTYDFMGKRPHDVNVVKHTFVTPVGRCIIHDCRAVRTLNKE